MNPVPRPDSFEAADYVGVLRRRWWIALALMIVGLVGAFGYVTVAPKVYSATASVNVVPTAADQSNAVAGSRTAGATVNLDTQAQVVTSTAVATLAGKMMHSPLTTWQLAQQVGVTVPPNSSILDITCKASTAAGAATCANDFATSYLQNRQQSAVNFVNQQLKTLQSQISALNAQEAALSTKIATLSTNSPQRAADTAALDSDKSKLSKLTQDYANTNGQLANTNGGTVITKASPPGKPSSPKKLLILPSGLVAGLLIGLIVAFLVDRRDKRIHNAIHAERVLDLPALLDLPPGAFGREVSIASPRSKTGQAFTDLAHGVAAALGEGNHVVFVAGATPGPAGSVVAANLAVTLARTHSEVVLVCANMNSTVAPKLLGLGEGEGLAELIAGNATVRDVVQGPAGMPGLWVITPGADPSLAFYHLQHDTARALTTQLRRDARFVIIEAQAADDGADTFALGEFADAAVVTIEVARTTKSEATECVRRLRQLRTPVLGAAILPALGKRIAVRPPRQGQPRPGSGPEPGRDGSAPGRGNSEFQPISGMSANMSDRRDRAARTRDGRGGRTDSVPGT
jgi:capsular polysaccharide biosynthesis protein/MinD-like ATPase involved in chromosome partitioning or flagellar assembly